MSDELAAFIDSLPSLDANLSEAELIQNASEAYQRYSALSPDMQSRVMAEANNRLGITPEKVEAFKPDEKTTRVYEAATRHRTSEQPAAPQADRPARFEDKWASAAANTRGVNSVNNSAGDNAEFARRHGDQAANNRHGYQPAGRQEQLDRIASIRAEAKRTGKSFSEVADARVAAGR